MNDEQRAEFDLISDQMIKFLNDNCHPHMTVIIDSTSAEVVEGVYRHGNFGFVRG